MPSNVEIAEMMERIADLLEARSENPHRIRAYRTGAQSVRAADRSVEQMVRAGDQDSLQNLPGVGTGLAGVITEFVNTGMSETLNNLEAKTSPEEVIAKVPSVGKALAQRVVEQLHVTSLEELEQAANDGRLEQVEGFGPKRVEAVRMSLAGMLSGAAQRHTARVIPPGTTTQKSDQPSIEALLAIDEEYRHKAEQGELKTITPRRFNPGSEAWLPIYRAKRDGWNFTALFSNTARAHQLGATHDWVVLYFEKEGRERQCTVVTASSGPLQGKRVVRGREADCRRYYEAAGANTRSS